MSLEAPRARESSHQASPANVESGADRLFITSLAMNLSSDARNNLQLIRGLKQEHQKRALGWLTMLREGIDIPHSPYAAIAQNLDSPALAVLIEKVREPDFFKKYT